MPTSNEILKKTNDLKPYTGDERILTSKIIIDCGTELEKASIIFAMSFLGSLC